MDYEIGIIQGVRRQILSEERFVSQMMLPAVLPAVRENPSQNMRRHVHDQLELRLLFQPWTSAENAFSRLQQICLTPPGVSHLTLISDDMKRHITIRIGVNELYYLRGAGNIQIFDRSRCSQPDGINTMDLILAIENAGQGKIKDLDHARLLLGMLLTVAVTTMENKEQTLSHNSADLIAAFIRANYYRNDLTIREIAQKTNFSPNYIQTIFRKQWGCTPVQYLNEVRLKAAKLLLKKHQYQIKEVAGMCGWDYSHYFCKKYREYFGYSPSEEA